MYVHHDDLGSLIDQRHERVLQEAQMRRLAKQAQVNRAARTSRLAVLVQRGAQPLLRAVGLPSYPITAL